MTFSHFGMSQQQLEKLSTAWFGFIASLAHDMRTPLLSIGFFSNAFAEMLPHLIKGYQLAVQHQLMAPAITPRRLQQLENSKGLEGVKEDLNELMEFLKQAYDFTEALVNTASIKSFSFKAFLNDFLEKYSFKNEAERGLIHVDLTNDFNFSYFNIFLDQLFDFLLSITLGQAEIENKSSVNISAETIDGYHLLHFKVTGGGLDESVQSTSVSRFFLKKGLGADKKLQPGLGFYKLTLLQLNGDLTVDAVKGKYTDFIIKFPRS